ncbi:hypothetical protein BKA70DRAFT_1460763 [Coprinopsis sp. MPI-PUGE-AT-0042]|nr:hypothetical protein BKA70DRAFT_1460763 [Coprinopsis sp. MPI-PUGE-AT-0042]
MPPRPPKPSSGARIELPQEIRTLITDHFDNDLPTLKSITLTDKGWSQRARELLFKHVYIGEPKPKLRCKALMKLVQKRPDLLRKTETLTLTEATTWKPKELATEGRIKSSKDLLITILPHLPLSEASLWRLQLCTLFAIPQLKSIAFNKVSNLQNVIALLSGYQHLERLSLMSSDTVQQPIWERPKIPGQCPASFPLDRRPVFMTDVTARPPNLRVFEYRNATFAWELLIEASLQRRANLSISDHPEQTRHPLNIKELWVQDIIPLPKDSISNPTASLERLHLSPSTRVYSTLSTSLRFRG